MRSSRRFVVPLLAGGLGLAGVMAAAPADSAGLRPLPGPGVQYCAAVLGHLPGADGASLMHGRACAPASWADALGRSDARVRADGGTRS
ncbi:hypothetical protein [Streptomyces sp. FH025]|uniref:hypothetical protein n=1 Tax=Streptomyces sp. FH025 TaxID=2815937 RepID=UPI001A9CC8AA|nr:hypothetical protein [Streptomyces sp. FH025]MBO1417637.1 hypothetical protein [Streptomyces sp. FH025]